MQAKTAGLTAGAATLNSFWRYGGANHDGILHGHSGHASRSNRVQQEQC
jgi:hypothetical protein